jgi:predicted  nucleic acid-binding Zn-ribbon protein
MDETGGAFAEASDDQGETLVLSQEEKCLRCGDLVTYEESEFGTFCPNCGWSREAAQSFEKTRPARIAKSILKAIGFGIIILFIAFGMFWLGRQYLHLAADGVAAVAEIQNKHIESLRKGRYEYIYEIEYAGHTAEWDTRARHDIGTQFMVVYLSSDPEIWAHGDEADSAWALAKREEGVLSFVAAGVFIVLAGSRLFHHVRSAILVLSRKDQLETKQTS